MMRLKRSLTRDARRLIESLNWHDIAAITQAMSQMCDNPGDTKRIVKTQKGYVVIRRAMTCHA